jgi:ferrous iron transport protein A
MPSPIKLSDLAVGSSAIVREFPRSGSAFVRLREMGVLAGTRVTLIRTAPMGDPIEIKVRGYNLMLRKSEADHVLVERAKDEGSTCAG